MSSTENPPRPARPLLLPFLLGDALLLGLALLVVRQAARPMTPWETITLFLCVACGAVLSSVPFWLEFRAATRAAESASLETSLARIQNLEALANQITGATVQWQAVRDDSAKTVSAARELSEKMAAEAQAFVAFLQKANDSERNHLRLEVEKLRRAEGDWLQVSVRILDHVFALHQGALKSGQPALIEQISGFQNACRDAARRLGLAPFAPAAGDVFDPSRHQNADEQAAVSPDAAVAEILAPGFTFQGQLVRRSLVRMQTPVEAIPEDTQPALI